MKNELSAGRRVLERVLRDDLARRYAGDHFAKARHAVRAIREAAAESGSAKITMEQINKEIRLTRKIPQTLKGSPRATSLE